MPLGLYYVTETTTPEGFKAALPFLVTVPMTNPADTSEWMYDINVYPKDRPAATKTVADEDVTSTKVGDKVKWTITSAAPETSKGFWMQDTLDAKLAFDSSVNVWLAGSGVASDNPAAIALYPATDYNIYLYEDGTPAQQTVFMELTDDGLKKLNAAVATDPALYVNWTFGTTVLATGVIENDATIFENRPVPERTVDPCDDGDDESCKPNETTPPTPEDCDPNEPCSPGETTPPATTKFGGVKLTKIASDKTGDEALLEGAEFKVLGGHDEATVCTSGLETGVEGATNDEGTLTLRALRASDWANGAQLTITDDGNGNDVIPSEWMFYCLVETKAPSGYELLPEGIPFQVISAGQTDLVVDAGEITNVPSKGGFQLPLTGGIGTVLFLVVGAGVIGAMFYIARRQGKKESAR